MLARRDDLAITWHEFPIFGASSEAMARALVAADLQEGYLAFKTEIQKAPFRPGPQPLATAARAAGLDADRLIAQMNGPAVENRIQETRATSRRLGIPGTPSVVIGKTVVIGRLTHETLDQVLLQPLETCAP